jgi:hypothetical protein
VGDIEKQMKLKAYKVSFGEFYVFYAAHSCQEARNTVKSPAFERLEFKTKRYPAWDSIARTMLRSGKIYPPLVVVRQQDWMPGFAALIESEDGSATLGGEAHVLLNLGAILAGVELGTTDKSEAQNVIADSLVHELMHVVESWTQVEFGEEAIERLLVRYRNESKP